MRRSMTQVVEGEVQAIPFENVFIEGEIPGIGKTARNMFGHLVGKQVRVTIEDLTPLVGDENSGVVTREVFDSMIGRLDRLLSEFLETAKLGKFDEADRQTLKHHADDLIGVGNAALKAVAR